MLFFEGMYKGVYIFNFYNVCFKQRLQGLGMCVFLYVFFRDGIGFFGLLVMLYFWIMLVINKNIFIFVRVWVVYDLGFVK